MPFLLCSVVCWFVLPAEDPRERDYLKTILHRIYGGWRAPACLPACPVFACPLFACHLCRGMPRLASAACVSRACNSPIATVTLPACLPPPSPCLHA